MLGSSETLNFGSHPNFSLVIDTRNAKFMYDVNLCCLYMCSGDVVSEAGSVMMGEGTEARLVENTLESIRLGPPTLLPSNQPHSVNIDCTYCCYLLKLGEFRIYLKLYPSSFLLMYPKYQTTSVVPLVFSLKTVPPALSL